MPLPLPRAAAVIVLVIGAIIMGAALIRNQSHHQVNEEKSPSADRADKPFGEQRPAR
jgi:hypothetical protein